MENVYAEVGASSARQEEKLSQAKVAIRRGEWLDATVLSVGAEVLGTTVVVCPGCGRHALRIDYSDFETHYVHTLQLTRKGLVQRQVCIAKFDGKRRARRA